MISLDDFPNNCKQISIRHLFERVNARLGQDRELRVARPEHRRRFGDYYISDTTRRVAVERHVNPEDLARKLGVLGLDEHVSYEEAGITAIWTHPAGRRRPMKPFRNSFNADASRRSRQITPDIRAA